jgi:hypothetical protein
MGDCEFKLMVAACGASFRAPLNGLPQPIDWNRFTSLAARHRVQALCWDSLAPLSEEIPDPPASVLRDQSRTIVASNLKAAAECQRLAIMFEAAGIPLLFLKGLALSALAYPKLYLKMGVDIDLLIEPRHVSEAADLLRSANYVLMSPVRNDARALKRWHHIRKESVWRRSDGEHQIDLHTKPADHLDMLPGLAANSPSQLVDVSTGISLRTLTDRDLFAYLCVHGASSAWFRLKWACDLAAFLERQSEDDVEELFERARELRAERAAGQALLLADKLFSIPLSARLREQLSASPAVRWLVRLAEDQLFNPTEPTDRLLGTATIHLSQFRMASGWRFKLSEALRQVRAMGGE